MADAGRENFSAWLEAELPGLRQRQISAREAEQRWSLARLGNFIGAGVVWIPLVGMPWLAGVAVLLFVAAFVYTVRRHQKERASREFLDRCVEVAEEAERRAGGSVVLIRDGRRPPDDEQVVDGGKIRDDGRRWRLTEQERDDLDLFGEPIAMFGLLNRCSSSRGARRLRDMLEQPLLEVSRIRERTESVKWLSDEADARIQLMAAAAEMRLEDRRFEQFLRAAADAEPLPFRVPLWLLRVWVVLGLLLVGFAIYRMVAFSQVEWWVFVGLLVIVNLVIYGRMRGALEERLRPLRAVAWGARAIGNFATVADQALRSAPMFEDLRAPLSEAARPGVLPKLTRWLGWTESGGIGQLIFNAFLFYDVFVLEACLRPMVSHREALLRSGTALGELEALLSLACFAAEEPVTAWPTWVMERRLEIVGGQHPLIEPERCVANDVRLDDQQHLWVITGSNMAGKSTFLRMAGVNALLAQVGAPAVAREMRLGPVRLMTDLRARDNLAKEESYFLAEVRHLRRLLATPEDNAPLLGLIDEPFRGTNTRDQTAASLAVVQHLLQSEHLILLATHDRELCDLADGTVARNVHFAENLDADGMVFDYTLREGPAQTRNALRILEREGYPAEVVAAAHAWAEESEARGQPNGERK